MASVVSGNAAIATVLMLPSEHTPQPSRQDEDPLTQAYKSSKSLHLLHAAEKGKSPLLRIAVLTVPLPPWVIVTPNLTLTTALIQRAHSLRDRRQAGG